MKWIFHEIEARVIYSLTTDRARSLNIHFTTDLQTVIHEYWATNHLLARISFDSNTQETVKRQVFPSDVASFPPRILTEIEAFTCIL